MKDSKVLMISVILLFISAIFVFIEVSFSFFNYFGNGTTNNVIETGRIIFSYSDANGGTNGINIQDAVPIPDSLGKVLSGEREYFDFTVSASTTGTDIAYEVAVNKDDKSTLADKYAKIYLTSFEGNREVAVPLTTNENGVVTYQDLPDTNNSLLNGKTIYYGRVKAGEIAYGKRFRLRMWVAYNSGSDYDEINDKIFTLKVNVAATTNY